MSTSMKCRIVLLVSLFLYLLLGLLWSWTLFQVPGGPAHKSLEPGDVLIRMNGEVSVVHLTRFRDPHELGCYYESIAQHAFLNLSILSQTFYNIKNWNIKFFFCYLSVKLGCSYFHEGDVTCFAHLSYFVVGFSR